MDVDSVFDQSDVIAIPSLSEAFGHSAIEAMLKGCAIVSSDIEGLHEIFHDARGAMLVPAGNSRMLADALVHLLQNPDLRRRLGQEARQSVRRFSIEQTVSGFEQIYEEMLANGQQRLHALHV